MRRKIKIGVYSIFLLGIVDIAFSLTRFLSVQLGNEGQFRSITTIGKLFLIPENLNMSLLTHCF